MVALALPVARILYLLMITFSSLKSSVIVAISFTFFMVNTINGIGGYFSVDAYEATGDL